MATTGSVSTNKYSSTRYYTLSWTATQSVTHNTSTISWTLSAVGGSGWYAERTLNVSIDGDSVYSKTSRVERYAGTIATGTKTLTHKSDGTRTFTVAINAAVYVSSVNCTASQTCTLTTIPRKSDITSASDVTLGNACNVKWTPKSSSFTYKLKFSIGSSWSYTTGTIKPATTSAYPYTGYTIPVSCANYITTATTATMKVVLTTYSGSTSVGTAEKTFTVTVPSTCKPSVSSVTITEATSGLASAFGVYVQNKSTLKVVTTASTSYGSAIKTYSVSCQNKTYTGSTITTSALTTSGTITLTITVTDARGRTGSTTKSVTVYAYSSPVISAFSGERCNSDSTINTKGTYLKINYGYTISTVNNKNTRKVAISYKISSASSYTDISSLAINSTATSTSYSNTVYPITQFSTEYEYTLKITVSDYFTSVSKTIRIPSADTIMDILADGTGVAFGKVAENSETLDLAWPLYISSELTPAINIVNSGSSGYTGIKLTSWSEYALSLQVGSGGYNRGVYDDTGDGWIIHSDSSNRVCLGNSSQTTIIYGSSVYLNGTSTAVTSDRRLKTDFGEVDVYDELFDLLNPVSFKFISDGEEAKTHFGLIYQDVKESLESEGFNPTDFALINTYEENGCEYGAIGYMELISLLVYQVQALKERITILERNRG